MNRHSQYQHGGSPQYDLARLNLPARNIIFQNKWFIIDEAFIQFADIQKDNSFLFNQPRSNILVIHSLTKFYALAGLRLGGIAGAGEVISRLREAKEPWTVNGVADCVAPLLLECADYEHKTLSKLKAEREKIYLSLDKLDGFSPFPSSTNFFLFSRLTRV